MTSCTDMTPLLELAPLLGEDIPEGDLLDAAEAQALEEHLDRCGDCRARAEGLNGAYATWADAREDIMQPLSSELRDRVMTDRQDAAKKKKGLVNPKTADSQRVEALRSLVVLSCSFCHDGMQRDASVFCAACLAPHHRDCFEDHGRCCMPGCEGLGFVRPSDVERPRRKGGRLLTIFLAASAAALSGGIAALTLSESPETAMVPNREDARPIPGGERTPPDTREGMRINVDFEGQDLRDVMEQIGRQVGKNILVDPELKETVTISLRDIKWRDAVDAIARQQRCIVEEQAGGILMISRDPDAADYEAPPEMRIDVNLEDADLTEALEGIGRQVGRHIIVQDYVREPVTIKLEDTPWREALDAVAKAGRCATRDGRYGLIEVGYDPEGEGPSPRPEPTEATEPEPLPKLERPKRGEASVVVQKKNGRLHLDTEGVDLGDLMTQISKASNHNIIVQPGINERVRVSLRAIPIEEAVDVMARMTRCNTSLLPGNVIYVSKPTLVTLQFTSANVRTVMGMISAYTGKNIIVGPQVQGTFSPDFKQVHWQTAVRSVADTVGAHVTWLGEDALVTARPLPPAIVPGAPGPVFTLRKGLPKQKTVTVDVKDMPLEDVCEQIGREVGRNILVDPTVEVKVTTHLADLEWHHAVIALTHLTNTEAEMRPGGIVLITQPPKATIQANACDAKTLYKILLDYGGKNVSISDEVAGTITTKLHRIHWLEATRYLAAANGHRITFTTQDMVTLTQGKWTTPGSYFVQHSVGGKTLAEAHALVDAAFDAIEAAREQDGYAGNLFPDLIAAMDAVRAVERDAKKLKEAQAAWDARLGTTWARDLKQIRGFVLKVSAVVTLESDHPEETSAGVINGFIYRPGGKVPDVAGLVVTGFSPGKVRFRYKGIEFERRLFE